MWLVKPDYIGNKAPFVIESLKGLTLLSDRLRGHRDQITGMRFLQSGSNEDGPSTSNGSYKPPSFLVTCAKDTFVKLWDLTTQHCIQTIVAHRSEVWSLDIDPAGAIILTGSGEGEVKAWRVDQQALRDGIQATPSGEVSHGTYRT